MEMDLVPIKQQVRSVAKANYYKRRGGDTHIVLLLVTTILLNFRQHLVLSTTMVAGGRGMPVR